MEHCALCSVQFIVVTLSSCERPERHLFSFLAAPWDIQALLSQLLYTYVCSPLPNFRKKTIMGWTYFQGPQCYSKCKSSKFMPGIKGQLISKCPFGVFKSSEKPTKIFSRISALASKKRSNQENKGTLYH